MHFVPFLVFPFFSHDVFLCFFYFYYPNFSFLSFSYPIFLYSSSSLFVLPCPPILFLIMSIVYFTWLFPFLPCQPPLLIFSSLYLVSVWVFMSFYHIFSLYLYSDPAFLLFYFLTVPISLFTMWVDLSLIPFRCLCSSHSECFPTYVCISSHFSRRPGYLGSSECGTKRDHTQQTRRGGSAYHHHSGGRVQTDERWAKFICLFTWR